DHSVETRSHPAGPDVFRAGSFLAEDEMHSILDNLYFQMFAAWPGILILCALFSMLCQWSFSWSELILDYLAGMLIGLFFFLGTEKKPHEAVQFFFIFSQGLPG